MERSNFLETCTAKSELAMSEFLDPRKFLAEKLLAIKT